MDPITLAIASGLGSLGQEVIKDAYSALKAALQQKCGVDSDVLGAVDKLEQKPESNARQAMLQEEIINSGADQDKELLQLANSLIEQLKNIPGSKIDVRQDVNIRGNRNIVSGQGDVTVNE